MENLVKNIIYSSIQNFFENEHDFFDYTSQTGMTEWNLTYHLCNELSKYIFWLNKEVDVTKRNYENKRPDIIFHKRRTNKFNFLVVEVKKNPHDKRLDIIKLKEDWMKEPLEYRFGVYINIWNKYKFEAILITRDGEEIQINETTSKYIPFTTIQEQFKDIIKIIIDEICIEPRDKPLNKLLEEKLDNEILRGFSLEK
ncbi:hypothetical protein ACT3XG_17370 [Paenibacillus polymyxa]|jgi:hypothetical protein|uniref:hypothetical protein n=1 Tax=Paenibacillus TaxID=44249 RepID=UPI000D3101D5|nr:MULTISPECIES: hypothetical protein [Paenibacillus]MDP9674314.1 hypothetical protein [Paenibacillus jamilae]KAF6615080.1 hypothetical protein HFE00_22345 [Paenibacillus sp. EKM101P]KAF6622199.1 hypothetical protein HFE03_13905 [Paenibacillus sp. EKM102P]KAF6631251.1 hypothetical protein HFE01_13050 [Paenibacillus sp. EKM10P]KAF6650222.1 hypothetical protein HFE02_05925 [Paenibacillus sp. EKM11P]